MKLTRRLLLGAAAASSIVKSAKAILFSGIGSGSLPAGVQLVPIDGETSTLPGGNNYFTRNGFTNAANAGFDNIFMIIGWWPGIGNVQYVRNLSDVGINAISSMSPPTTTTPPGSTDPNALSFFGTSGVSGHGVPTAVWLIQGMSNLTSGGGANNGPGYLGWMTGAGTETIGYLPVDEPNWWNNTGTTDIVNTVAGTNPWTPSIPIPAHFQDGKFCWINFNHNLLNNIGTPPSFYAQGNYPALAASVTLNNNTQGVNFGTAHPSMTPPEILYTKILNGDGNPVSIAVTGEDMYWFSDPPSSSITNNEGIGGAVGAFFGAWDPSGSGINVSGTFATAPGTTIGTVSFGAGTILNSNSILSANPSVVKLQSFAALTGSGNVSITSITWSATGGGQITIVTSPAMSLAPGTLVGVAGTTPSGYNGLYVTIAGTSGANIVVAQPSNLGPGSGGNANASGSILCPITAFTPNSSITLGPAFSASGSGTYSNWSIQAATLSPDQAQRGSHYGDRVDAIRAYQSNANSNKTPVTGSIENYSQSAAAPPLGNNWIQILPPQYNAAVWGSIIHGARVFYSISGDTYNSPYFDPGNPIKPYYTIQAGDTVSYYDRGKATHHLVHTLESVLLSPFAEGTLANGYVHVTGDNAGGSTAGFRSPYRPLDYGITPNQQASYTLTTTPYSGSNATNFNRSLASAFEVMAKYYQGTTVTVNGVTLTNKGFWLFADYRGSQDDGPNGANANNIVATFSVANAPSSVTRLYSDSVIAATSSNGGTTTRIQCMETQQIVNGDTVRIRGTNGVAGLNADLQVSGSPPTRTTFDVNLPFPGGAILPAITNATWASTSGGQATFTTVIPHGIGVGVTGVVVGGINPSGFNGTYTTLAGTAGSTIVVALASNPGAFVSGGNGTGKGVFIAEHTVTTLSGSTFTDAFPTGGCIGIYRINP